MINLIGILLVLLCEEDIGFQLAIGGDRRRTDSLPDL
jgi:hypothetical protein